MNSIAYSREPSALERRGDREEGPHVGRPTQIMWKRPGWDRPVRPATGAMDEPLCGALASESRNSAGLLADSSSGVVDPTPPTRVFVAAGGAPRRGRGRTAWPVVAGFEILEVLGRGGMGVVYKARQVNLNRLVALKMVLAGDHAGPTALARFHKEAQAVASLQHPGIVQIHDVGDADGLPYFCLEFVDGGNLAHRIHGRPQDITQAAWTIRNVARAIHAAHLQGIVHRDLKPANILLTADGRPKIADFGLAKRLGDDTHQTKTGNIVGTPNYMAPEQVRGQADDASPLVDQHALGVILYELLTGRPPFHGSTPSETIEQVRTQDPEPPTSLQPEVPRDLETICLKCLQKEPHRRYADANALADDLDRFLDGRPVLARRISAVEHLGRRCRRNPGIAGLLAAVVVLSVTVVITSTVFAAHLARAHGAAIAAFRGECQNSYELQSDIQRAALALEQATREARLAHDQAARARDALSALVAQVRSLEDRPDLRDARRDLLRTATSALDAFATKTESPTFSPTLALPALSAAKSASQGPGSATSAMNGPPADWKIRSLKTIIDDTSGVSENFARGHDPSPGRDHR
jgi:predicted Ser/Thr protein kinase